MVVVTAMRGISKLLARKASAISDPTEDDARHQGSPTNSASVTLRRWAKRLFMPTTTRKWS